MVSQKQQLKDHDEKVEKAEKKGPPKQEERNEILVRVMDYDIPGSKNIYSGLTRIKGISWSISNIVCLHLKIDKSKKVETLTKDEIKKIENFLRELPIPDFFKNRRFDRATGEPKHYFGSDLDIKKEFDIKALKEIRSYKGIRHAAKLPVRGQRTRSHFRSKGVAMGVKKKAK